MAAILLCLSIALSACGAGPSAPPQLTPVPDAVLDENTVVVLEPNILTRDPVPGLAIATNPENQAVARVNAEALSFVLAEAGTPTKPFTLILWTPVSSLGEQETAFLAGIAETVPGLEFPDIERTTQVATQLYRAAHPAETQPGPENAFAGAVVAALRCLPYGEYRSVTRASGIPGIVPLSEADYGRFAAALCGQRFLVEPGRVQTNA
jgi:hypothetical protein